MSDAKSNLPTECPKRSPEVALRETIALLERAQIRVEAMDGHMIEATSGRVAMIDGLKDALSHLETLTAKIAAAEKLAETLQKVVDWKEFPKTGQFWKNEDGTQSDREMSYGFCYGSNGERDYMRNISRGGLAAWHEANGAKPNEVG